MKRVFFMFIVFTMSVFIIGCDNDPYVGKYKTSNNMILDLSLNGNCKIINNFYKEAFYTNGRHTIKDNEIEITYNNKQNYLRVECLKGK